MKNEAKYPIKYISLKTGFSQLLIRTWENRYNILQPTRTKTNRRLYSESDLEKLQLIKVAIDSGFKIGDIATLDLEELKKLNPELNYEFDNKLVINDDIFGDSIEFIKNYDSDNFQKLIDIQIIQHSKFELIHSYIFPLLEKIGEQWELGEVTIAQEHFATSIIRNSLGNLINNKDKNSKDTILVGTPSKQNHELMAISLAVILSDLNFKVIYLGASVPSDEIINTAQKTNASAIVLSIIYPENDLSLLDELKHLDRSLKDKKIYIGGSSARAYYKELKRTSIKYFEDLKSFVRTIKFDFK